MLKIKALLSKICERLASIDDYVIDRGTSGNWTYTKWASGRVEAEGYATFTTPSFSATGSIYRSSPLAFTIPSGIFTAAPSEAHGWIRSSSATVYFGTVIGTSSATDGTCQIFKSTSGNATANVSVHMRLIQL